LSHSHTMHSSIGFLLKSCVKKPSLDMPTSTQLQSVLDGYKDDLNTMKNYCSTNVTRGVNTHVYFDSCPLYLAAIEHGPTIVPSPLLRNTYPRSIPHLSEPVSQNRVSNSTRQIRAPELGPRRRSVESPWNVALHPSARLHSENLRSQLGMRRSRSLAGVAKSSSIDRLGDLDRLECLAMKGTHASRFSQRPSASPPRRKRGGRITRRPGGPAGSSH
jgi:hypothetical protein